MIKFRFTVIILLISIISFAQSNNNPTLDDSLGLTEILIQSNYSIQYPNSWDLDTSKQMGSSFALYSKLTSTNDQFRENINLIIQKNLEDTLDLDTYIDLSEKQVSKLISKFRMIESQRMKNNDLEFHKFLYKGKYGTLKLKFEQYIWLIDKQAYVLTLTCETNEFENYQKVGEKILDSFKIEK